MNKGVSQGFTLQLLDSALGQPLQSWDCSGLDRVTIGRSEDNHICVVDPRVSRLHVELLSREGKWHLESHGRNGTWIQGAKVDRIDVTHQMIFQLGSNGPMLQILIYEAPNEIPSATLDNLEQFEFEFLNFNQQQLAEEVTKITESESFQRLQSESKRQRESKQFGGGTH